MVMKVVVVGESRAEQTRARRMVVILIQQKTVVGGDAAHAGAG